MVQQKVNMFGNDMVPLSLQSPLVVLLSHGPFSLRGIQLHPELLTRLNPFVCPCEKNITVCVFKRRVLLSAEAGFNAIRSYQLHFVAF